MQDWKSMIMNRMPIGWVKAFGELLCEELSEAVSKLDEDDLDEFERFHILDVKEKFGYLRIYYGGKSSDEICEIINKYEFISKYICIYCGRPDVPDVRVIGAGWTIPCCSDCYYEHKICGHPYDECVLDSDNDIPDVLVLHTYFGGEWKDIEFDISETVKKIRRL